ncbi:S-norcoclaurine synthase 2-like [Sesamum indicum]|uniref:S-norcoclaurine synthase 2-like n=1 Tax=Sesamum indicum TaxID=4182 RepID=A0A6I9THZ9_SESIN|nr:S-norcoclaurine synthase 2-like [Sesamum indicum]
MVGRVWEEKEVKVPASEAWKLYGSLQLGKLVKEALPNVVSKIEVVQGDGSAGTILQVVLPPGTAGLTSYKEKYTVVDDERRVKEAEVVEGGVLDLGFTLYRVRTEVIEKEGKKEECVVRATIEYELREEAAANAALVSIEPLVAVMQLAADYLTRHSTTTTTN